MNQEEIGTAIQEAIREGIVRREDLFIVTKVWNTDHDPKHLAETVQQSMRELQVTYLDLLLMQWPVSWVYPADGKFDWEEKFFPRNDKGGCHQADIPVADTWNAMDLLVKQGFVRSIGVCNFSIADLETHFAHARIPPAVNQVEIHPRCAQEQLRAFHKLHNIVTMSFCPLGMENEEGACKPLVDDPIIQTIAAEANLSPFQLLLQWNVQSGNVCLTKSVHWDRIRENASTPCNGLSELTMQKLRHYSATHHARCVNPTYMFETERPFFADSDATSKGVFNNQPTGHNMRVRDEERWSEAQRR
jgi:diketogulonate reductase-like aldo/keto reductase